MSIEIDKKVLYKKILNNLLNIKKSDPTIFTKINSYSCFDIFRKIGPKTADIITRKSWINISLDEKKFKELVQRISYSENPDEIISEFKYRHITLPQKLKESLLKKQNFYLIKKEIIKKINKYVSEKNRSWLILDRKARDLNDTENIWLLHIATGFISLSINGKSIYAPLLLQKVSLDVQNESSTIKSVDNWEINEKLLFVLNKYNIKLKLPKITGSISPYNFINQTFLSKNNNISNISRKFQEKKITDILNQEIKLESGVVIGLFQPSGGALREQMNSIIEKDDIDSILDIDADKTIYSNNLFQEIKEPTKFKIKLDKLDYSQTKALCSGLIQDTIIWGPPGTGKSQVITNLIANILYNENSAIILSRKKAALDVLFERLKEVSQFVFFLLNERNNKKEFYEKLSAFIYTMESYIIESQIKKDIVITKEEIEALQALESQKINNQYYPSTKLAKLMYYNEEYYKRVWQFDDTIVYPLEILETWKQYRTKICEINNIDVKKFLFFHFYPKETKELAQKLLTTININNSFDLNHYIKLSTQTTKSNVSDILKWINTLNNNSLLLESQYDQILRKLSQYLARQCYKKIDKWKRNKSSPLYHRYMLFKRSVNSAWFLPKTFLNRYKDIIARLFRVIVTTPENATSLNSHKEAFDYAIIDEASQMFIELGLPILYLAKIKVISGDNQQMQPTRWFQTRDESYAENTIPDVEENAESILEYASIKGVYEVMLNRNYRSSSAALMSFSAKQFYNSELSVVNKNNYREESPIDVININGHWEKGINILEAKAAVELAIEYLNSYSSILILAFNVKQRDFIEELLIEDKRVSHYYNSGVIKLRNIENVQGDEADLLIISVVYDSTTWLYGTYVARPGGRNALNVALSRAKEKMIVLKSIHDSEVFVSKSDDLNTFKLWLNFLELSESQKAQYSKLNNKKTSKNFSDKLINKNFKNDVIKSLITAKHDEHELYPYQIVKNYSVGSINIDIAVLSLNSEKFYLGIKLDDYSYAPSWDNYLKDISEQQYLENKGYPIFRLQEINWIINKDDVLKKIFSKCN